MKRPPDRKFLLAAMALAVAASLLSVAQSGLAHKAEAAPMFNGLLSHTGS